MVEITQQYLAETGAPASDGADGAAAKEEALANGTLHFLARK